MEAIQREKKIVKINVDSSFGFMPVIPQEITIEILSRLPVKSICRFKSVCKFMYKLPSDPNFIKLHIKRSPHSQIAMVNSLSNGSVSFYRVSKVVHNGIRMDLMIEKCLTFQNFEMGTPCDGLICMFAKNDPRGYVVNPSTHEFLRISNLIQRAKFGGFSKSVFCIGLDATTNTYKLLKMMIRKRLRVFRKRRCFEGEVLNLGSTDEQWRSVEGTPYLIQSIGNIKSVDDDTSYSFRDNESVYINGTSNWLIDLTDDNQSGILSFNFQDEKFRILPLPELEGPRIKDWSYLKMCDGCICFLDMMESWILNIWLLKDYTSLKWMKEYTIDLNEIGVPVGILRYCSVEVWGRKVTFQWEKMIYSYDLQRKTVETLVLTMPFKLSNYVESLVSPFSLHQLWHT
ncbi:hypothetical protein GIB67_042263 [Kingdonia uniflora]|uniref:F-box domain-containing protein n=1 Tax=Kingdonia uniflora TaxID=39325 RepID=A0A7J7LE79_9MAGN|nr:hypothetical protein GIB67_042263 [Kingdonia uniflora]